MDGNPFFEKAAEMKFGWRRIAGTANSQLGLADTIAPALSRERDLLIVADSKLSDLARANDIQVPDLKAAVSEKARRFR